MSSANPPFLQVFPRHSGPFWRARLEGGQLRCSRRSYVRFLDDLAGESRRSQAPVGLGSLRRLPRQFRFYPFVGPPNGSLSHLAMFRLGLLLYLPVYILSVSDLGAHVCL